LKGIHLSARGVKRGAPTGDQRHANAPFFFPRFSACFATAAGLDGVKKKSGRTSKKDGESSGSNHGIFGEGEYARSCYRGGSGGGGGCGRSRRFRVFSVLHGWNGP